MSQSIKHIIGDIVTGLQSSDSPPVTLRFYFGDKAYQNVKADEEVFPAVYLDNPVKMTFEVQQSGYIKQLYTMDLFFIDKTDYDASEEEIEAVLIQMRQFVKKFLISAETNVLIRLTDDFPYRAEGYEFQNIFDVNVSGLALNLTVELLDDESFC